MRPFLLCLSVLLPLTAAAPTRADDVRKSVGFFAGPHFLVDDAAKDIFGSTLWGAGMTFTTPGKKANCQVEHTFVYRGGSQTIQAGATSGKASVSAYGYRVGTTHGPANGLGFRYGLAVGLDSTHFTYSVRQPVGAPGSVSDNAISFAIQPSASYAFTRNLALKATYTINLGGVERAGEEVELCGLALALGGSF